MAGKVNTKQLQNLVLNNASLKREVLGLARKAVDQEKQKLIENFSNHPVTQEIAGGENATNISRTLGGYGNLFTFIGFSKDANPIAPVLQAFQTIRVLKVSVRGNRYQIDINIPSKDDLAEASRMPWETGRSWLWDIERSISGLGAYLYGKFEQSRSGKGIQTRKNYSNRIFTRVTYFTSIYNNFVKRIKTL